MDKRILQKLLNRLDNTVHLLHNILIKQRREFSPRPLPYAPITLFARRDLLFREVVEVSYRKQYLIGNNKIIFMTSFFVTNCVFLFCTQKYFHRSRKTDIIKPMFLIGWTKFSGFVCLVTVLTVSMATSLTLGHASPLRWLHAFIKIRQRLLSVAWQLAGVNSVDANKTKKLQVMSWFCNHSITEEVS